MTFNPLLTKASSVTSTLDSFIKYHVKISGEVNLEIKHNLVNHSGDLEDIKNVVSHSQPLAHRSFQMLC